VENQILHPRPSSKAPYQSRLPIDLQTIHLEAKQWNP
jgi:hypothetical protein